MTRARIASITLCALSLLSLIYNFGLLFRI